MKVSSQGTAGKTTGLLENVGGDVFGFPRWSPDGRSVAFTTAGATTQVRTIAVAGGPSRVLATTSALDVWAASSTDGARIAYGGTSDLPDGLFSVNVDGSDAHALIEGYRLGDVYWIP